VRRSVRLGLVIAALLIAASAIPSLGFEVNTFGFNWTFYRGVVVLLSVVTLILYRGEIRITARKENLLWMGFMLIWLIYGAVLLVVSPFSDPGRGTLELFSILCGLLSFYILSGLRLTDREIETLLRVLFFLLLGLVILGFYEIITGNHLSFSMFNDPDNLVKHRWSIHTASGIMYNINDFSALLTLMCPVVIGRFRIRFRWGYFDPGWLLLIAVIVINRINDANTSIIAIIVGVVLYFALPLTGDRRKMGKLLLVLAIAILAVVLYFVVMEAEDEGFLNRVFGLVKETTEGKGSLHSRILIYRDDLVAAWRSGLMGLGPAGFPVYYTRYPMDSASGFVNPHSLVLEILSQYGVVICIGFLFLLCRLVKKMYRIYKVKTSCEQQKEWGRMGVIIIVVYLIVTFASSSYLLNTLHWTLLALLCLIADMESERNDETG